jgi:hypothetical protein
MDGWMYNQQMMLLCNAAPCPTQPCQLACPLASRHVPNPNPNTKEKSKIRQKKERKKPLINSVEVWPKMAAS